MSPSPSVYPTRFKVIASLLLALALGLFLLAYVRSTADDDDPTLTGDGGNRDYVEELIPAKGGQIMQQGTVGIDLAAGWQGVLVIQDREVPADQLVNDQGLNRVMFAPGPDKLFQSLPTGQLCVRALVWEAAAGRDSQRTVSWCFDVI